MTAFAPITPMKAIELVEGAAIDDARRILSEFTAAGLVKSYALVIETIDASGERATVRGAAISAELWQRIVREGVADDVWTIGTVRLQGSNLIGGSPAASITGITFSPKHVQWLIDHHNGSPQSRRRKTMGARARESINAEHVPATPSPEIGKSQPRHRAPDASAIPSGALLATVNQTMAATGFGRTKINDLMNDGTLVRKRIGRAVRIEVASIRALAGDLNHEVG